MKRIRTHAPKATVIAVGAALLLAVSLPGIAAAAPVPIRFDIYLGGQCVDGVASPDAVVDVVWKDATGAVKARVTALNFYGRWSYCAPDPSTVVEIGDSIKASDGSSTRTLVLPRLTVNVNRVDDVVRGKGPAGAMLRLNCGGGPFPSPFEPCQWHANVRVAASGSWSLRPGWDLLGGESFGIRWLSAAGDKVWAFGAGPFVTVTLGSSRFSGATRPNRTAHLVIRDGTTFDVLATGSAVGGGFSGRFRDNQGHAVPISAGDILSSDISPDIDWIVPDIDAAASPSTDVVSGRCYDAGTAGDVVKIRLFRAGQQRGWAIEGTESDGSFSVYFPGIVFPDPAVVKSGDRILISCMQTNADSVQKSFIVP